MATELHSPKVPVLQKTGNLNTSSYEINSSGGKSASIKAFRPRPAQETTPVAKNAKASKYQNLFPSPLPSPGPHAREDTLKSICDALESRLEAEINAQSSLKHRICDADEENKMILEEEAIKHGGRMAILSKKITSTREALRSLENAKFDYDHSAQKVHSTEARLKAVEDKIKSRQRHSTVVPSALDKKTTWKLRCELDEATAMMAAAFRRVEQIETLTDHLIHQLADAEEELAEVTALRQEENEQHSTEIARLTREKNHASKQLSEVRKKEVSLRKELARAAETVDQLADQVESEGRLRDEVEHKLLEQRQTLERSLEEAKAREQELSMEIAIKEKELEEAVSQGTPVGNGAKIVLPMAFQRIRETQQALEEETKMRSAVEAELETLKRQMTSRIQELEAERVHQVAEKQSSLESMTRAAATAAAEAAIAQDALRTLEKEANAKIAALETAFAAALKQHKEKSQAEREEEVARAVAHCIVQGAISKALALEDSTFNFTRCLDSANVSILALKQGLEVARGEAAELQTQLAQVREKGEDRIAAIESQLKAVCSQRDATMIALQESSAASETALAQLRATGMALQDRAQAAESAVLEKQRCLDATMARMAEVVRLKELAQEQCLQQASLVRQLQDDVRSEQMQNTKQQEDIEKLKKKVEETKIAAEIASSKRTASLERCLLATQRRLGIISSVNEELIDVFKAREKAVVEIRRVAAAREAEISRVMRNSEDTINTLLERTQLEVSTSSAHANSALELVQNVRKQNHQDALNATGELVGSKEAKPTEVSRIRKVLKTSRKMNSLSLTTGECHLEKRLKTDDDSRIVDDKSVHGSTSNHCSFYRRSSTVAAVFACAIAILWSSAVGGEERAKGDSLQVRKAVQS